MTYLRVFLSIQSNVSLFIQWITRSFTKAFSRSTTRLNEPDSAQNNAASSVGSSAIFPEELVVQVAFFGTLKFLLDLPAFEKSKRVRHAIRIGRNIRRNRRLAHIGKRLACLGGKEKTFFSDISDGIPSDATQHAACRNHSAYIKIKDSHKDTWLAIVQAWNTAV
ncbi:hypothetical protein ACROYT_G006051 [Oculina patagonica]